MWLAAVISAVQPYVFDTAPAPCRSAAEAAAAELDVEKAARAAAEDKVAELTRRLVAADSTKSAAAATERTTVARLEGELAEASRVVNHERRTAGERCARLLRLQVMPQ
jgi:hypothetical protein